MISSDNGYSMHTANMSTKAASLASHTLQSQEKVGVAFETRLHVRSTECSDGDSGRSQFVCSQLGAVEEKKGRADNPNARELDGFILQREKCTIFCFEAVLSATSPGHSLIAGVYLLSLASGIITLFGVEIDFILWH